MEKGKVYLVGAGPGDYKLITLKGLECIKKADVLVYDRLVSKRLLTYVKNGCELIYGGKYPDHHVMRQGEINDVLVEKALSGKVVTRLKGGDPFVFGRGGEEAEALVKHGISFEVVPGISSSIAVPAYAGIPVTHRDFTTSFAVITGHLQPDKADSAIAWDKISTAHGTLIFLMGMEKLPLIIAKLIENGRSPETPIALVRWGTTPKQTTMVGTLTDILDKARANNFGSPAVIVVGEVVNLREKLKWIEDKPLFGRRILVVRNRDQVSALADKLEDLGAEVWEFPVYNIEQGNTHKEIISQALKDGEIDLVSFASSATVLNFMELVGKENLKELFTVAKVASMGPKTSQTASELGLVVDAESSTSSIDGLADAISSLCNKMV